MPTETQIDLEKFKDALGFTVTFKKWGNRRKADITKVETDADKNQLGLTKKLIKSKELDAINSFFAELRGWVYGRTVPGFKKGFQLAGKDAKPTIEARLKKAVAEELPPLIATLQLAFPGQVEDARAALNGQFNAADYPTTDQLADLFAIDWLWVDFVPAQALSAEERAAEGEKLQKRMLDAGEEIIQALRASFQELLAHAVDKLTPGEDGKPKVFRDSLTENISEFLETFSSRNIMADTELDALVAKAREIMVTTDPNRLRKLPSVREETAKQFGEIKAALDTMIETRKGRAFDFSE